MHRTWTWKIFSIATDFRGGLAGAKERLRLIQSIKDFHGPPCSPACNTPPEAAAPLRQPEAASILRGVGNYLYSTVSARWFGDEMEGTLRFSLQGQDRDEELLVLSRVPPAVTSLASASECFSPRSSPCTVNLQEERGLAKSYTDWPITVAR
jgi:hypothetical protein